MDQRTREMYSSTQKGDDQGWWFEVISKGQKREFLIKECYAWRVLLPFFPRIHAANKVSLNLMKRVLKQSGPRLCLRQNRRKIKFRKGQVFHSGIFLLLFFFFLPPTYLTPKNSMTDIIPYQFTWLIVSIMPNHEKSAFANRCFKINEKSCKRKYLFIKGYLT